jgi:hypothetical protein
MKKAIVADAKLIWVFRHAEAYNRLRSAYHQTWTITPR